MHTIRLSTTSFIAACVVLGHGAISAAELPDQVTDALGRAGDNKPQIEEALAKVPAAHNEAMQFLVANMPDQDLKKLSAKFLLENVRIAHETWEQSPWKSDVPKEVFLNNILPYASINERRDEWRKDFRERFGPLVKDAKSPGKAAAILNQKIFPELKVRYSTKRPKADQSPYESIEAGTASCTGLSVLLIDACRSVGVPARFVGTPLWTNKSGNHSWVEVWDNGWQFTGAAEPSGDELNRAWFAGRASTAERDHPLHAIYATSFKRTPIHFPMVWATQNQSVFAVNVTDRYTRRAEKLPEGVVPVMFRALDGKNGERQTASLKIVDSTGTKVFEGKTKDDRFDANDHVVVPLKQGEKYKLNLCFGDRQIKTVFEAKTAAQLFTFRIDEAKPISATIVALSKYLAAERSKRSKLADQEFASKALSKEEAAAAKELLWEDHVQQIRKSRAEEMKARTVRIGNLDMPFFYKTFGEKPATGRSLYFSLHGGGGAPKQVNDSQWENQKRLYSLTEGVYLVPRAPTNTWNLWHQGHIDAMFDRLIENLIVFEGVDPNRVYVMGYSAGGDGVYQLAPRMADRWAGASMMAGHPNETSPLGLRNIAFTLHVGGRDGAYNRNNVARQWQQQLAALHKDDPKGYVHWAKIYEDKGHWLDRQDAAAIPWMAKHVRNPFPKRIVWKQDDVTHARFYWLDVDSENRHGRTHIVATREGQTIDIQAPANVKRLTVRLNDAMIDFAQPIKITSAGKVRFEGRAERTVAVLAKTLAERGDSKAIFSSEVSVELAPIKDANEKKSVDEKPTAN
jgi:hypothetical protein